MSPEELRRRLDAPGAAPLLLDVREPWEVERAALPAARCIPLRELPARAAELDPARETVVLCHHGVRSRAACRLLEEGRRFADLRNLTGGIDAWARRVDPAVPTY